MFYQLKRNSCSSQIRLELNTVNFTFLHNLPGINFHSKNHSKTKLNHFTLVLEFPTERVSLSDKKCQNLFYVINIFHVYKKKWKPVWLWLYTFVGSSVKFGEGVILVILVTKLYLLFNSIYSEQNKKSDKKGELVENIKPNTCISYQLIDNLKYIIAIHVCWKWMELMLAWIRCGIILQVFFLLSVNNKSCFGYFWKATQKRSCFAASVPF